MAGVGVGEEQWSSLHPIEEKAMPKNVQTTAQLPPIHKLAK